MGSPELIGDEQDLAMPRWRTQEWRINANVSGHLYLCDGEAMVDLQLHFTSDADALMWEVKRVMPIMGQLGCTESGGLGWWGLRFSRDQTSAVLAFVNKVTASREFYRW
jgi:hypothetical protein